LVDSVMLIHQSSDRVPFGPRYRSVRF
jgi:hypothetical protein